MLQPFPSSQIQVLAPYRFSNYGSNTMAATNDEQYVCGPIFWEDSTSHTVSSAGGKVFFVSEVGGFTWSNGSSDLRVGIQDLDSSGNPDGTFDVYKTVNGGAGLVGSLNAISMATGTKTISHLQRVAIGMKFINRAGSDLFGVVNYSSIQNVGVNKGGQTYFYMNGAKNSNPPPMIMIQADDGAWGWVYGGGISFVDSIAYNLNTGGADEYGTGFELSSEIQIAGLALYIKDIDAGDDFELVIYSDPWGTPSIIRTETINHGAYGLDLNAGWSEFLAFFSSPLTLPAAEYLMTARPTTANDIEIARVDGGATYGANLKKSWGPYGQSICLGKRLNNSGAFTKTDYQAMGIGLILNAVHDGVGGSGNFAWVSG